MATEKDRRGETEGEGVSGEQRSFWLIERGANQRQSPTVWWKGRDSFGDVWTEDVHQAAKFPTKVAGIAVALLHHMEFYVVTSHGFMDESDADCGDEGVYCGDSECDACVPPLPSSRNYPAKK